MSRCRSCGKEILWVTMKTGRKMPVDPGRVRYVKQEPSFGDKTLVLEDGTTLRCRYANPDEAADGTGYVPHWATCDNANRFRTSGTRKETRE